MTDYVYLDGSVADVLRLASETSDAFSAEAWGAIGWARATQMLCHIRVAVEGNMIKQPLTREQIEGVLRSKYTRWARDMAMEDTVDEYLVSLHQMVSKLTREQIQDLVV